MKTNPYTEIEMDAEWLEIMVRDSEYADNDDLEIDYESAQQDESGYWFMYARGKSDGILYHLVAETDGNIYIRN